MKYWNDPYHFSMQFGDLMLRGFLGDTAPGMPADVALPLNPDSVEDILRKRRRGLQEWISKNPDFVAAFEKAKSAYPSLR